jgi:membrane protease YdiL (CAAX protease family)
VNAAGASDFVHFAIYGLLIFSAAVQLTEVRPFALERDRLWRLITHETCEFVFMVGLVVLWTFGAARDVPQFLAVSGEVGVFEYARMGFSSGPVVGILVALVLVLVSVVCIAGQWAVAGLKRARRTDIVYTTTGRRERAIRGFTTLITAPVGEELIYRVLFPAFLFAATHSVWTSLAIPFAVFVVFHYSQGWLGILNAALIGVATVLVYLATEQVVFAIVLHLVANALSTIVAPELRLRRVRRIVRDAMSATA